MAVDATAINLLLDHLGEDTWRAFGGTSEQLHTGQVLIRSGDRQVDAYFPGTAVLSLFAFTSSGESSEVARVGHEGMAGLSAVLGSSASPTMCVVRRSGTCWRAPIAAVRAARATNGCVREVIDSYVAEQLDQLQTATILGHAGHAASPDEFDALSVLRIMSAQLLNASLQERDARERAESSDRAKGEYLEMVSHELRSPLQAVLGWSALARLPNPPAGTLDAIERNARAQLALVNDLLDAARMTAHTLEVVLSPVDVAGIVEAAVETVRPAADAKAVALRLSRPCEPVLVRADGRRVQQVVVNILMNAVKFSPDESEIEIQVRAEADSIVIAVTDHGIGVSSDMLPHVFERFWQGPRSSGYQGLGLGLAIARTLIELQGGRIVLESDGEGRGATCIISFPDFNPPRQAALGQDQAHPVLL